MPCVQSTIPTKTVPLKRLMFLLRADNTKKLDLIISCNPVQYGYLGLYGLKYASSSGLNLLIKLHLDTVLGKSKTTLNVRRII